MTSLTIDNTYVGGLSKAVKDATDAGHNTLILQPGVYAADTFLSTDGTRGPGRDVPRLTIKPQGSRDSIAIGRPTINKCNYLRWLGCTFADGLVTSPQPYTTALVVANSNMTFTPVVTDTPIPRVRVVDPQALSAAESISVTVSGRDVTVSGLGTAATGKSTTTADTIVTALNANSDVTALFTTTVKAGEDGTGAVEGGFPYFALTYPCVPALDFEADTHHVEVIGCELARVTLNKGCNNIKNVANYHRINSGNFGFSCSMNDQDRCIFNIHVVRNHMYGCYNADAMIRPSEWNGWWIEDNLFDTQIDVLSSAIHADCLQMTFSGSTAFIRRNKFIDIEGQNIFISNYFNFHITFEGNVVNQHYTTNGTAQKISFGDIQPLIVRHNTFDTVQVAFSAGSTPLEGQAVVYNNVFKGTVQQVAGGTRMFIHENNLYSGVSGFTANASEITATAVFVDDGYPDWNYHLDPSSRGVNEGSANPSGSWTALAFDLDGAAIPQGAGVDMGAYEQ